MLPGQDGSSSSLFQNAPITGLCMIAQMCPQGYIPIDKCYDKPSEEANLWGGSALFAKKSKRFLCVTRLFPLEGGRLNNVLVSMVLLEDKDQPPPGYSLINATVDTGEAALHKRQLAVQMIPRSAAREAICEIVFLSKNRKLLPLYSMVGEIGGLCLCYRSSLMPQLAAPVVNGGGSVYDGIPPPSGTSVMGAPAAYQPSATTSVSAMLPLSVPSLPYPLTPSAQHSCMVSSAAPTGALQREQQRFSTIAKTGPLSDVPFELSSKLKEVGSVSNVLAPNFRYRSAGDLHREYSYSFATEEAAAARMVMH